MTTRRTLNIFLAILFVFNGVHAYSQKEFLRAQRVRKSYYAQKGKCRGLMKSRRWKEAEVVCTNALSTAKQFGDDGNDKDLVLSDAYSLSGHVMMAQKRYREALGYYQHALDAVSARLTETDGELGELYGNIAVAHHGLGDLDKARELYRKSEGIYRLAIADIDDEQFERQYRNSLKEILGFRRLAAEQAGATSEVEEIKKQLENLP
jgi:tetratricopeptide (TPR) repeat protein